MVLMVSIAAISDALATSRAEFVFKLRQSGKLELN